MESALWVLFPPPCLYSPPPRRSPWIGFFLSHFLVDPAPLRGRAQCWELTSLFSPETLQINESQKRRFAQFCLSVSLFQERENSHLQSRERGGGSPSRFRLLGARKVTSTTPFLISFLYFYPDAQTSKRSHAGRIAGVGSVADLLGLPFWTEPQRGNLSLKRLRLPGKGFAAGVGGRGKEREERGGEASGENFLVFLFPPLLRHVWGSWPMLH